MVTITERNYFKTGDVVEIFGPNIETFSFIMPDIYNENNDKIKDLQGWSFKKNRNFKMSKSFMRKY